jgi:Dihydroxynaphthoic acid synthase
VEFEDILYEVAGGRATITINRPDRLNAFRVQTIRELCTAFEDAADDEAVGVIVFTGAGDRAFCVGGDVRDPPARPPRSVGCTTSTTAWPSPSATTASRSSRRSAGTASVAATSSTSCAT